MRTLQQLLRKRLVGGWSAADRGCDVQIFQRESIVAIGGVGLIGESGFIEHREHEFAGGIPREGASGAVGAMRTGSQTHDEYARSGIAETGHGLAPVLAVAISAALLAGHLLAIDDQARAASAGNDFPVENG